MCLVFINTLWTRHFYMFISSVVFLSYEEPEVRGHEAAICGHQILYPHPSSVSQIPSISPAITRVTAARWAALEVLIQGLDPSSIQTWGAASIPVIAAD